MAPIVMGAVRVEWRRLILQTPPIIFTSGMEGVSIALDLDPAWNEFPVLFASFFATDIILNADIVNNSVLVPAKILSRPFSKVYMSVTGQDIKPDEATITEAIEINARLSAIEKALRTAGPAETPVLMATYSALHEHLNSMNLVRKRNPTLWSRIGTVVPGCQLP